MNHVATRVVIITSREAAREIERGALAKQDSMKRQRLSLTREATLQIPLEKSFGAWRKRAEATQEKN